MSTLRTLFMCIALGLVLNACKKKEDDTPQPTPPPADPPSYTINGPAVFTGTVDGTAILYRGDQGGIQNLQERSGVDVLTFSSRFFEPVQDLYVATVRLAGLEADPTDEEFYAFFEPGQRNYWSLEQQVGVMIEIPGKNTTALEVAAQDGMNFSITDTQPYTDDTGLTKVKVRAEFSCRLFGLQTSELTNGIFVGVFTK